jgi:crotonobetainyl-CoA:carnitine CoA-transferase CaiB-like acyl-CoA transferase
MGGGRITEIAGKAGSGPGRPGPGPVSGLTVIDLSEGIAGPFCTKLLADFGARVVKVELPDGDPSRRWGPYRGGGVDPEASGTFLHLNTNKDGVVVDWRQPAGAGVIRDLLASADVMVETSRPGALDDVGLGAEALRRDFPGLVVTSLTAFGQTGPYCDYDLTEIVAFAMGGPMNASGTVDREPVKLIGNVVQMHAGANACAATLGAVFHARRTGRGQQVDVAVFETQNGSLDRRRYYHLSYQYSSTVTVRQAVVGLARPAPGGRFLAGDGRWITAGRVWPDHLVRMVAVLRDPVVDKLFAEGGAAAVNDAPEEVNTAIAAWAGARESRQAMREAQAQGWPVVVVNDPLSLLHDDHLVKRGFWVESDHPVAGRLPYCGPPWRMADGGWALSRTAPLLGQDTDRVLSEMAGYDAGYIAELRRCDVAS